MPRIPAHPIEKYIVERWSPRAMSGEPLPREELNRLFEAARWAPSWGNSQPWRYVLTRRVTPPFDALLATLDPGNQAWANKAAALVLVCSTRTKADGKPLPTHHFDTGASWMALALQARAMNLVVHGMGGFDPPAARKVCNVPENIDIHCVVAIGKPGNVADLPEKYREREKPNDRDPIEQHVVDNKFG